MVIAGGAAELGLPAVVLVPASTEPAMVIAGGRPRPGSHPDGAHRFNGAGDGDRRRVPVLLLAISAIGMLQRSRRW